MASERARLLARRLLGRGQRSAPPELRESAVALSAELEQIERPRAALAGAAGAVASVWLLVHLFRRPAPRTT